MSRLWSFLCDTYSQRRKKSSIVAGLLHWSIPERRIADNTLPTIPQDIYLAIFDHIQQSDDDNDDNDYKSHLVNLTLVCRFFNAVFVARLFNTIKLDRYLTKWSDSRTSSFYRALIHDREPVRSLRLHVRSCTVTLPEFANNRSSHHPQKALARLINLTSLELSRIIICTALLEAIGTLEQLTSLSIIFCEFPSDLIFPAKLSLHLQSFTYINAYTVASLAECLARFIGPLSLRALDTGCANFLRAFISQSVDFCLEELTLPLTGDIIPDLIQFLNRTPSITTLSFPVFSWDKPMFFHGLSPTALPLLQTLHCPSCLVADFVPGRPIRRIDLDAPAIPTCGDIRLPETGLGDGLRLFSVLQQSTAAIEMLHVPVDTYFVASFGDYFPRLQTLCLEYPAQRKPSDFTENIDALCQRWTSTPPLFELRIKSRHCWSSWMFDLEMQHQLIVSSVVVAFPTLKQVVFTESVEWRRHQHKWRAVIPRAARVTLRARLQSNCLPIIRDYDGCLASLFQPGELDNGVQEMLGQALQPSNYVPSVFVIN